MTGGIDYCSTNKHDKILLRTAEKIAHNASNSYLERDDYLEPEEFTWNLGKFAACMAQQLYAEEMGWA